MIKKIIEDNNYMLTSKEERDERLTNLIKQSLAKRIKEFCERYDLNMESQMIKEILALSEDSNGI